MVEEYQPLDTHLIQADITALSGQQDEGAPEADVCKWQLVTTGVFVFREYPEGTSS
jgi:surfactin synthase thioesterase subunit